MCEGGDVNSVSSANGLSILQAQVNFMTFGAVEQRLIKEVRKPLSDENCDENWSPMKEAIARVKKENIQLKKNDDYE